MTGLWGGVAEPPRPIIKCFLSQLACSVYLIGIEKASGYQAGMGGLRVQEVLTSERKGVRVGCASLGTTERC